MRGEIAVIDHLPRRVGIGGAGKREDRARLLLRVVAGIGGGGGVAFAHSAIHLRDADGAGPASVPRHLKTIIPVRGKFYGKLSLGPDHAANIAVLAQIRRGGHQLCGFDLDVGAKGHRGHLFALLDRSGQRAGGYKGTQQGGFQGRHDSS